MNPVADFVISRTFDAPRSLVWDVWTKSEHLQHWFGPKGFTAKATIMDFRPGGMYRYCLASPEGAELWGRCVYREIVKPEKIVFINSFSDPQGGITRHPFSADPWPLEMLATYEFTEAEGKTTVTIRWVPYNSTPEEIATFEAGRAGMTQGWTGTMDRCTEFMAAFAGVKS